jgi:hypothetical protein
VADAERRRLEEDGDAWRRWGPYLSERQWGTVREDYSAGGDAWTFFPHDHARSRAYRWGEDGLGGISDIHQLLCFAFSFWNGRDRIPKERIFGLTGREGNHGEDAKEYWWYLDATPTYSWMRWRYVYPQQAFPYERLIEENGRRDRTQPEFELEDTGVLDQGYWDISAEYAKADPDDICIWLTVRNEGATADTLHVLPTVWFRNRWGWEPDRYRAELFALDDRIVADHRELGRRVLTGSGDPELLFCENETNAKRLWNAAPTPPYPKDGIGDHVMTGAQTVNPDRRGTKAALWYRLSVAAGETQEIRLRFSSSSRDIDDEWETTLSNRAREANAFYGRLAGNVTEEEARVLRQAMAGMLWSKQFYLYDVERWLDGDPTQPPPPPARHDGRNAGWRHFDSFEVLSMPDPWEYPWFAAWDLGFHCIPLARLDPEFAKEQLILLCREWFMHPNGQLPAYEWNFSDANPPVHAWAALRVFHMDGSNDFEFLERIFHKLSINFTWWVNRKDTEGNNLFEGGFLGLDNIGPFDRSEPLPGGEHLEQSDGTAWMAMYCLNMLEMSLLLAEHDPVYQDMATKFFEHFTYIASAMNARGLWDEEDGFYYDVLHKGGGEAIPLRARSIVGLVPLFATARLTPRTEARLPEFHERLRWFTQHHPEYTGVISTDEEGAHTGKRLLSVVDADRLKRILHRMLDEDEFLSLHGIRSVSRYHADHPLRIEFEGGTASMDYEPGEGTTGMYGGNSNWRGPIWFPVNYMLIGALLRFHHHLGAGFTVEHPTGSGRMVNLEHVALDLSRRLTGIFLPDANGRRPLFGNSERFQTDPAWRDSLLFYEYFHGDDGRGLGASHQTGWTGLVADLIVRSGKASSRRTDGNGL